MDDGMNDDVAASRAMPSGQAQQKRGSTSSTSNDPAEGHFQGFRKNSKSGGIFSKEGAIGKHFPAQGGAGEQEGNKEGISGKRIDRSEMYGGYGA